MTTLRAWQEDCAYLALNQYLDGEKHFLCLATPGAGKSIMAAEVASRLLDENLIDFVLCFSPSREVASGLKKTFQFSLKNRFDGYFGSLGDSLTYQAMINLDENFWLLLKHSRVLVVFDEIHHCAGMALSDANRWGEAILENIQAQATYTLALTGTPWRTDSLPISLGHYLDADNGIICDYSYGLRQAITDRVCRFPKVVLIDNDKIELTSESQTETFNSLQSYLSKGKGTYLSFIHDENCICYLLKLAMAKLEELRKSKPNAGGLIVASSVSHALNIQRLLKEKFNKDTRLVTYRHNNSSEIIDSFRRSSDEWIISIGMISEGTDIPRLQVCCHLSSVKTEMYFRQVLGRIMRIENSGTEEAWMYTFAEPNLSMFAHRMDIEVPDYKITTTHTVDLSLSTKQEEHLTLARTDTEYLQVDWSTDTYSDTPIKDSKLVFSNPTVETSYFDVVGQFREKIISTFS
ncbi:DEAD/DEAH box helicase [Enterovibrio norvegicus]|uniref:Diguanylate cyclase n=1 Tax=Enterovibrio norvegicus TaxID=188144 RepID=A0A2N7L8M8_9GAMM|nr:DEAD/DEAH box helicase family protein [Enterovibrio norvegicus]PMN90661.1 diguanylate cyclase [Enterovibrio norvegicus]